MDGWMDGWMDRLMDRKDRYNFVIFLYKITVKKWN